jgi:dCMP deaminase
VAALRGALRGVNFTDPERLRPGWDAYFMALAELASERTNCMKRRVGCVIARNRRLVATGYNGTPSRVRNCLDGGCARCNGSESRAGVGLDLCLCLHAEENAIIEAGRERCEGATLYTNLFPCILCAKKIIQAGVCRVVYSMAYATDAASEALLRAGQVAVEAHEPVPHRSQGA